MKFKMILASGSPRRKELLGHLRFPFEIITSDVEEISTKEKIEDIVEELAMIKGEAVFKTESGKGDNPFIISADTIVVLENKIYGKPKSLEDSKSILLELAGTTHQVLTAVAIHHLDENNIKKSFSFYQSTNVSMNETNPEILKRYLDSGDGKDKAGAYGIQGSGLMFISDVQGSYSNVVGFPLELFITKMEAYFQETFKQSFWDSF
jgi:septum formation protein